MIKVGKVKRYITRIGKRTKKPRESEILYTYNDVEYDSDKWADSSLFLPEDFDLVLLDIEGKKPISGWYNASQWTGLRLRKGDKVKRWKRLIENREEYT
jgi:hypothetical protein